MNFYEVYVASIRNQKSEALTYSTGEKLAVGAVVAVPFGNKEALGFVAKKAAKPEFDTKSILRVIPAGVLPAPLIKLFDWLQSYYPAGSGPTSQLFLPSALLKMVPEDLLPKKPKKQKEMPELPPLTKGQTKVLSAMKTGQRFILHGDTGSGKTRIYIERSLAAFKAGKSALILTPEIALTPQLKVDFAGQFGKSVVIIHSNLTAKARRLIWLRVAATKEPLVIIGPRSALFSPVKNLGLIVVDEFHEPAYKQEQAPRYQAVRAAGALASFHGAQIIYGSATPLVADYCLMVAAGVPVLRLTGSASGDNGEAETEIISLADKSLFTRHPFIADKMIKAIGSTLNNKEQALIYLNRRGTARLVICQNCGWQALCPRCDLPLTYHGDKHHLRCHTCGYSAKAPLSCPTCGSTELQYRTMGTKALVETLQEFFPQARIRRFDTDLGVNEHLDKHFDEVRAGEVDILVGTQMLGKGLDLPHLSLVGVVAADTSLYLPDFTTSERSYQLLHQVMGRVGRGHPLASGKGKVLIQTYVPDNMVLQAAIRKDWDYFYKTELIERKTFLFPPFVYLLKINASRATTESAEKYIESLHSKLLMTKLKVRLSDPAPAYYEHTHNLYHWQLVLKATDRSELIKAIRSLPSGNWTYDLDPANLL